MVCKTVGFLHKFDDIRRVRQRKEIVAARSTQDRPSKVLIDEGIRYGKYFFIFARVKGQEKSRTGHLLSCLSDGHLMQSTARRSVVIQMDQPDDSNLYCQLVMTSQIERPVCK